MLRVVGGRWCRWPAWGPGWSLVWVWFLGPVGCSHWLRIQTRVQILPLVNPEKFPLSVAKLRKQVRVALPGLVGAGPSPLHGAEQPVHRAPHRRAGQNGGERGSPPQGAGRGGSVYRPPSGSAEQRPAPWKSGVTNPSPRTGRGTARGRINLRGLGAGRGLSEWPQP